MKWPLLFAVLLSLITFSAVATEPPAPGIGDVLEGSVRPTDGDSLRMGDKRIRLYGIDAPESAQTCELKTGTWACGRASRKALERLTQGQTVTCHVRDMDGERFVSLCSAGDVDINRAMVERGWAVAYYQFSMKYVFAEFRARRQGLALWRSSFQRPHDWRRAERRRREVAASEQVPPDPACALKGNISRSGNRIVHAPGQADYGRTHIDISRGERWFCSLEEAEAAGWRAALR